MTLRTLLPAVFLIAASCTVGPPGTVDIAGDDGSDNGGGAGGGGDDVGVGPDAAPNTDGTGTLSLTTSGGLDLSLGMDGTIDVTVTSVNGYQGDVDLSVNGALASWDVSVEPAIVTVPAGGSATATLTVSIPTDAEAAETGVPLTVVATPLEEALDSELTASASVAVENIYHWTIANGTGGIDQPHAWPVVTIRLGATIAFTNADSTDHRVHSSYDPDETGFAHEAGELEQGQTYSVTIIKAGVYNKFYCHDHGAATGNGVITVVDPATL